jgi:anti-anti-sigma factor
MSGRIERLWLDDAPGYRPPRIEASAVGAPLPVLCCGGELDGAVAPELEAILDRICAEEPAGVLLDFSDVELIDSTILAALSRARFKLAEAGAIVRIAAGGQPLRLLRLAELDRVMVTVACRPYGRRHRPAAAARTGVGRAGRPSWRP